MVILQTDEMEKTRMKKILYTGVMITALAFCLAGCDGEEDENTTSSAAQEVEEQTTSSEEKVDVDFSAKALADVILDGGSFKDNLAEVDKTMALTRLYSLDPEQIEDSMFYTNSQATAEEIAVIKVKSEDYIQSVKDAYTARIEDQKNACESYLPDEMPKLESAIIYENGKYIVLCVSENNDEALELIEAQFQ